MADVTVAKCDGGHFDPSLGFVKDPIVECPSEPLPLMPGANDLDQVKHFVNHGWVRRLFRGGPEWDAPTKWWAFCPDHVLVAVEQYYLARFSDDGE